MARVRIGGRFRQQAGFISGLRPTARKIGARLSQIVSLSLEKALSLGACSHARTRATSLVHLCYKGRGIPTAAYPTLATTLPFPHAFSSSFVMSAMSMMNQSAPE